MSKILKVLNALIGRVNIHSDLKDSNSTRLLHISDTPSSIYPELKRLIAVLEPDYIVHTGDIADNLKLELYPSCMNRFKHESVKILQILDQSKAKRVFLALGNHDDLDYIKEHSGRIELIQDYEVINLEGISFAISHYSDLLKDIDADMYLYGHDLSVDSHNENGRILLNGISAIHLIDLETGDVKKMNYPVGTNDERLKRRKTKL